MNKHLPLAAKSEPPPQKTAKSISLALEGSPKQWASKLGNLGFSKMSLKKDSLGLVHQISSDAKGEGFESISFELKKGCLNLTIYHTSKNKSLRELQAARLSLLILSASQSRLLPPRLGAFIAQSLDEAILHISQNPRLLLEQNRQLQKKAEALEKKIQNLYSEREKLAKKSIEDASKISALSSKLESLANPPDSIIDEQMLAWLTSHDGQITIGDFCKTHQIPPARAEQSLDRLAKSGHIERVKK